VVVADIALRIHLALGQQQLEEVLQGGDRDLPATRVAQHFTRRAQAILTLLVRKVRLVIEVADVFPQATVELWTTDEHRIGLKPLLRKTWAPIGQRPTAVVQHRFAWRYLVGFVHPASGRTLFRPATAVSIPLFETELAAFARQAGAGPDRQIVLVLHRAGWHASQRLRVPNHVHLPPAYSRELNIMERLWRYLKGKLVCHRWWNDLEHLQQATQTLLDGLTRHFHATAGPALGQHSNPSKTFALLLSRTLILLRNGFWWRNRPA